jgi:hypothetical protein
MKHFKDSNRNIINVRCSDHPRTIITESNKQKVDVLINEDSRLTGKSLGTA